MAFILAQRRTDMTVQVPAGELMGDGGRRLAGRDEHACIRDVGCTQRAGRCIFWMHCDCLARKVLGRNR